MQFHHVLDRTASILVQPQWYFSDDTDALDFGDGATYVTLLSTTGAVLAMVLGGGLFSMGGTGLLGSLFVLALTPVIAIVMAFIAAGIIHLVVGFLGCRQDFGTSFSIAAASAALYPVTVLTGMIPVIGPLIGLVWSWWLVSEGVVGAHHIDRGSARICFGILYGLLGLISLLG